MSRQLKRADLDDRRRRQHGLGDPATVDQRAVATVEIPNHELRWRLNQYRVIPRDSAVGQTQHIAVIPTNRRRGRFDGMNTFEFLFVTNHEKQSSCHVALILPIPRTGRSGPNHQHQRLSLACPRVAADYCR